MGIGPDHRRFTGIPLSPPPAVLDEVETAGRRAEELLEHGRELHFEVDDDSGRVIVLVRDLEGNAIRAIPPSAALDIMSGRPL
jgi:flagellar protein FlaG